MARIERQGRVSSDVRRQALDELAAEISSCTRCPLSATRTRAVPGEGHADTEVVFIGEGPGFNEDRDGRPFVGAAGGLLNDLLRAIGWKREEVFITNVVKCRPPGNRDPEPNEIAACAPFLRRQLEALDPALVVTLGRHSLGTFMPGARIGATHGTHAPTDPQTGAGNALTYALYHPAAALRQHSLKETMLADMAGLPEALLESRARRTREIESETVPTEQVAIAVSPEPERDAIDAVLAAAGAGVAEAADENQMQLFG